MGRTAPTYTRVFENELNRIIKVAKILGDEYIKYGRTIVEFVRRLKGELSKNPNPDLEIDILYILLLELFRRVEACEGVDSRDLQGFLRRRI